ncbi:uncharacterized protein JCM15063_004070 [Sporobolomyces koalae]|uniref:uncharacterized protein n=1 Tax=Sporobolomyces koalae TaxID=500713 RepID=UPI00316BA1BC
MLARGVTAARSRVRRVATAAVSTPPPADAALGSRRSIRDLLQDLDNVVRDTTLVQPAWLDRIRAAIAHLDQQHRPAHISIIGEHDASVEGVTTAILDDPLTNTNDAQDVTVALEARRLGPHPPQAIEIQYADRVESTLDRLALPAKWLRDNQIVLTEIVHRDVPPLESSFSTLHLSDAVIVLLSSTSLLSSPAAQTVLLNLHSKPNLIVCVNTHDASPAATTSILDTLQHQLDTLFPPSSSPTSPSPVVMALSTEQALAALAALDGTANPSFEQFQTGYLASQIPKLKSILSEIVASGPSSRLREQTAAHVLECALSRAAFSTATNQDSLASAHSSLLALNQQATESSQRLLTSLGIDSDTGMFPLPQQELLESRQALQRVFDERLQFYKLPFKSDDISSELSLVATQTYLIEFEKHLLYSTGLFVSHASALQQSLTTLLDASPFSKPPLQSELVHNSIEQALAPHPESPTQIPSTALSTPIQTRRAQLTSSRSSPISTLHRRAQSALFSSSIVSLTSISSAIGLFFGQAVELANCVGLGVLGTTFAVWSLQGKWNKAKSKFWKDFDRLNDGVSEDLGVVVKNLVQRCQYTTNLAIRSYGSRISTEQLKVERIGSELKRIAREAQANK